jgi:hypothetical protein
MQLADNIRALGRLISELRVCRIITVGVPVKEKILEEQISTVNSLFYRSWRRT